MAIFYPEFEIIRNFKVKPTEGELTLLNFLASTLDDSFEVYFNPFLNGDRPDIIIMRKDYGVMIIEVKDWNLNQYHLNEKKKWIITQNGSVVKSPIDQVLRYKSNLFDLHVPELLKLRIQNIRNFNIVSCAIYFHCASKSTIENLLINPYLDDEKYQKFLKYNVDFLGKDSLNSLDEILRKRYIKAPRKSFLFTGNLYVSFKRILSPSIHLSTQGSGYSYSPEQKKLYIQQH